MKVAVIHFPGSHGLDATVFAYAHVLGCETVIVRDTEENLHGAELVVVPGGSSFGDYLRPGGLAKVTRIVGSIRRFAQDGGPVLGIGNGFQILCEIGLLPGALIINRSTDFVGGKVHVRVDSDRSPFTTGLNGKVLELPIGCYFGSYYADYRTLKDLEDGGNVAIRYCDEDGELEPELDLTGSINQIAGVISRQGNVIGMMVHPELAVDEATGGTDGRNLLLPRS